MLRSIVPRVSAKQRAQALHSLFHELQVVTWHQRQYVDSENWKKTWKIYLTVIRNLQYVFNVIFVKIVIACKNIFFALWQDYILHSANVFEGQFSH